MDGSGIISRWKIRFQGTKLRPLFRTLNFHKFAIMSLLVLASCWTLAEQIWTAKRDILVCGCNIDKCSSFKYPSLLIHLICQRKLLCWAQYNQDYHFFMVFYKIQGFIDKILHKCERKVTVKISLYLICSQTRPLFVNNYKLCREAKTNYKRLPACSSSHLKKQDHRQK